MGVNAELIDDLLKNHHITEIQAREAKEVDKQTYLNGRTNFEYGVNQRAGKAGEFLKNFAEHQPSDMSKDQYQKAGEAVLKQANFIESLRAQDENLKSQQMLNQIATNVGAITQTDWDAFANTVTPQRAEKVRFSYIQALKKNEVESGARDALIKAYDNPEMQAMADHKVKDAAFIKQVNYAMQNSHKTNIPMKSPASVSLDQAEVQVASNAGGPIPVFTRTLKYKLASSNSNTAFSGVQQIHSLLQNGNGQALKGLEEQDWSMYSAAQALLDSPDPVKALQDAHNRIYNQDQEVEKLNKTKWSSILTKQNSAGLSNDNFALKTFGFSKSDFINPTIASAYGLNILGKMSNFLPLYQVIMMKQKDQLKDGLMRIMVILS